MFKEMIDMEGTSTAHIRAPFSHTKRSKSHKRDRCGGLDQRICSGTRIRKSCDGPSAS